MAYSYEEKYCIADNALLLIGQELMKYSKGEQTLATTVDQTAAIVMAYRELRIGVMAEDE